jgi:hypothetical protein
VAVAVDGAVALAVAAGSGADCWAEGQCDA